MAHWQGCQCLIGKADRVVAIDYVRLATLVEQVLSLQSKLDELPLVASSGVPHHPEGADDDPSVPENMQTFNGKEENPPYHHTFNYSRKLGRRRSCSALRLSAAGFV